MREPGTLPVLEPHVLERLAGLSPAKRAFVEQRLRAVRDAALPGIPRRCGDEPAPLSFAQELLWDIERSAPGLGTYNVPAALRIRGELDAARLQRALDGLVERHEALRTTFARRDGASVQIVGAPRPVELRSLDLSAAGTAQAGQAAQAAKLRDLLRAATNRAFDLTQDQLLRATLVRLAHDEHVLLLVWHHAASDAASRDFLLRDLAALYGAEPHTQLTALAPLPLRYTDFAVWERAALSSERLAALQAYWSAHLQGAPARLELPAKRPRGAQPAFGGARLRRSLGPSAASGVAAFARANGVTPFITLLAAFSTLLQRYSRQTDVVVATVFSGRGRPELDGVVGFFSNVLPLRTRFSAALTFEDLVRQLRETYFGATEHADMPFERLVDRLADGAAAPALQVMFSVRDDAGALPSLGAATLEPLELERDVAKFELTVALHARPDGIGAEVEYRTDLFERDTIVRVLEHFENLLQACLAAPAAPLYEANMLSSAERTELVQAWNGSARPGPGDLTLVDLIAAQAACSPVAVAVADARSTLTYGELMLRAERVARLLRASGAGPGVFVAVALERSVELLVGLLGVLRAGAAYVPLDPAFPPQRLATALADCGAPVVLTQQSFETFVHGLLDEAAAGARSKSAHGADARPAVITLEAACAPQTSAAADSPPADGPLMSAAAQSTRESAAATTPRAGETATPPQSGEAAPPRARAEDPAYLIYTSGSTGRPKGVAVTHGSLANFLLSMLREPGLDAGDTLLAVTTLSFDIAGLELWLPLIAGARVFVADRAAAADGLRLAELLESSAATLLQATPATWRLLLETGWRGRPGLRMLCGGEALPPALAAELLPRGDALWNMYGPTETTIWSALQRIAPDEPIRLGEPVANTQLYVLEPGGTLAPLGIAGELYIGGAGVALGYHGREALTAERFVPDPFAERPGARLYRTGDLVRRHPGGGLEFLGRLDEQIKLRGFRIELGEVEAALAGCDGIERAVAALRDDSQNGPRLVAYYVAATAADIRPAELRRTLAKTLPEYMLPSNFVRLAQLPLTANGKLDRSALPAPEEAPAEEARSAAPQTPLEADVAAAWQVVLKLKVVGRDDDFFALGGHSLLAVRVLNVVNEQFGVRLGLAALFEAPTVAGMAAAVELQLAGQLESAGADGAGLLAELEHLSEAEALALLHADLAESAS